MKHCRFVASLRSRTPIPATMLAASLLLSGCSAIRVKLGMRIPLDKIPVASMQASLPNDPGIAPGEKSPLVVQITATDGKVYQTEGKGKGKVQWKDLSIQAEVVTASKKGVLSLAHDPRVSDGKTAHVTITAPSHPGIETSLDIPLRYDYPFKATYAGASGINGIDGTSGTDGTPGTPGSLDPNNPSAGGNGGDGTDGGDGSNGATEATARQSTSKSPFALELTPCSKLPFLSQAIATAIT